MTLLDRFRRPPPEPPIRTAPKHPTCPTCADPDLPLNPEAPTDFSGYTTPTEWQSQEAGLVAKMLERRIPIPFWSSDTTRREVFWSYLPRSRHEKFARRHGYFWLPCGLCGLEYGGHELTISVYCNPEKPGSGHGVCPMCTVEITGGTLL